MRFYLAILSIALVAQVCFASPIQRSKRGTDDVMGQVEVLKEMLTELKSQLESVIKELPKTDAYSKYESGLEDILKLYDTNDEFCLNKGGIIFQAMVWYKNELEKDGSVESKKVKETIAKYNEQGRGKELTEAAAKAREASLTEMLETC